MKCFIGGLQHESFLDSYFVGLSVLIPFLQDVSIESEYRRYSKATQQSLQVWNGEQIDLGLVGFLLCLPSLSHLLAPASVLIFHASNACNNECHKRMSLVTSFVTDLLILNAFGICRWRPHLSTSV